MATKNPRLNVVLDPKLYKELRNIANTEGISMSLAARDLLKEAMELHEDTYWQQIAQERENTFSHENALSHEDVWE